MSGGPNSASSSLGGDQPTLASVDHAGASASSSQLSGVTLPRGATLGRYTVLEAVGRGGMGTVYAAYDPQLDRKVALKVLRPRGGRPPRPRDRARLQREAQAMARLSHPNVIAVHDVAESQGELFVAMEFVDGGTLQDWLAEEPRRWDEIRDVFVEAGMGLAAAHAAGLVHRDFKPDNVLIDRRGRVRVTDFGLARAEAEGVASEDASDQPSVGSPLAEPLTLAGALMGTPAFMAPEQHARLSVEPRTDQFSFCVALYKAFFGQHPFSGTTVAELAAAVTMGQIKEPARDSVVPTPVRRAVLRGLSRLPEERWPSMNELLEALRFDPRRRRRRLGLAAGGVLIALVAGGGVYGVLASGAEQAAAARGCTGAGAAMDGVWNDERRAAISAAFADTARPEAAAAFERAATTIDAYAMEWQQESRAACEATRVEGVQSDEMLDLRTGCLRRQLDELDATLAVLGQPERAIVENAAEIADNLTPLSVCADTARLRGVQPLPDDPALAASTQELWRELAAINAQSVAGRATTVLGRGKEAVTRAEQIDHPPLLAEALHALADLHMAVGDFPKARETLRRAGTTASLAGDDLLLARVYNEWLDLLGRYEARYEDALLFSVATEAAIERAGRPPHTVTQFLLLRGNAHLGAGRYDEARRDYTAALEAAERMPGRVPPRAAATNNLGAVDFATGNFARARSRFEQSLALHRQFQGELHPDVAECLYNIGNTLLEENEVEAAIERYTEALEVLRMVGSGPSVSEAGIRNSLAVAYFTSGRLEEARREAEISLEQFKLRLGARSPSRAAPLVILAQLDVIDGRPERAEASLQEVIADLRETFGADHPHLSVPLAQLARMQIDAGEVEPARANLQRAIELAEAQGPSHPLVAPPLVDLARIERMEGRPERAIELLERAVAIIHGGINDRWEAGYGIFELAKGLITRGDARDRDRAIELAREASALLDGIGRRLPPTRDDVDAWLREHAG